MRKRDLATRNQRDYLSKREQTPALKGRKFFQRDSEGLACCCGGVESVNKPNVPFPRKDLKDPVDSCRRVLIVLNHLIAGFLEGNRVVGPAADCNSAGEDVKKPGNVFVVKQPPPA